MIPGRRCLAKESSRPMLAKRQVHFLLQFIAITKEEGKEEEKKKVVFWSTKSLAKKVSFFCSICCCFFDPIAANGIDVIHGCGGQQGVYVEGQQEGGGHQGGGQQ